MLKGKLVLRHKTPKDNEVVVAGGSRYLFRHCNNADINQELLTVFRTLQLSLLQKSLQQLPAIPFLPRQVKRTFE